MINEALLKLWNSRIGKPLLIAIPVGTIAAVGFAVLFSTKESPKSRAADASVGSVELQALKADQASNEKDVPSADFSKGNVHGIPIVAFNSDRAYKQEDEVWSGSNNKGDVKAEDAFPHDEPLVPEQPLTVRLIFDMTETPLKTKDSFTYEADKKEQPSPPSRGSTKIKHKLAR
jgi:hypothetical protein